MVRPRIALALGLNGAMYANIDPQNLNWNTVWPITFAYACWSGYFINIDKSVYTATTTVRWGRRCC